jgi:hypothetical protein
MYFKYFLLKTRFITTQNKTDYTSNQMQCIHLTNKDKLPYNTVQRRQWHSQSNCIRTSHWRQGSHHNDWRTFFLKVDTRAARQFSNKLSAAHGEQSLLTNETECFSFHTKLQCCYLNNNGNAAVRANFSTNSRMGHWSGWCRRFLSGVGAAGNQTTVNLSTHNDR